MNMFQLIGGFIGFMAVLILLAAFGFDVSTWIRG